MISAARRQEILDAVTAGIARGVPLAVVCESLGCPLRTVYNWIEAAAVEVKEVVGLARDLGYDWIAA